MNLQSFTFDKQNQTTIHDDSTARKGTAYQKDPSDDLKVVSWPPNKQFKDLNYYAYDVVGGQNVVLYLVEEGIHLRSPVRD